MTDKIATTFRRVVLWAAPLMLIWGLATAPARAQDATAPARTQSQIQTQNQQEFSEGQIEQLVAPIALYPDPLLTQVLMASTYPLEVVEAERWSHDNPSVKGEALQDAMQAQSWDPSVKALTAVAQTLQMMSDRLDWTQQLGDAFLAQQQDVLDAVQKLRAEAQAAGNLQSTPQQVVTTASAPPDIVASGVQQPVVIEPVNPNVYYIPVYDPAVVYGGWNYPADPPFYWSPTGFVASNVVSFASGVAVGAAIWGGCDWWHHNVIINVNRYNVFNRTNITNNVWIHNPEHRGNEPYRNATVAERFGRANEAAAREALRNRVDVEHPDFFRPMESDVGRAARDAAPAFPGRPAKDVAPDFAGDRKGDLTGRDVDQRFDRAKMPERRDFVTPRAKPEPQVMRSRAQVFKPAARGMGGGRFRVSGFRDGGRRPL